MQNKQLYCENDEYHVSVLFSENDIYEALQVIIIIFNSCLIDVIFRKSLNKSCTIDFLYFLSTHESDYP